VFYLHAIYTPLQYALGQGQIYKDNPEKYILDQSTIEDVFYTTETTSAKRRQNSFDDEITGTKTITYKNVLGSRYRVHLF
jgi:hypothetical protein